MRHVHDPYNTIFLQTLRFAIISVAYYYFHNAAKIQYYFDRHVLWSPLLSRGAIYLRELKFLRGARPTLANRTASFCVSVGRGSLPGFVFYLYWKHGSFALAHLFHIHPRYDDDKRGYRSILELVEAQKHRPLHDPNSCQRAPRCTSIGS
jgi:hypothetical protein